MYFNEGRYIYQNGIQIAATVAPDAELNAEYIVFALNEFERLKGGA